MAVNTIFFDLDGTLIDTAPDLAYALNALLLENDVAEKSYEAIKPLVSRGGRALVAMGFGCDELDPEFSKRHQRFLQIYIDNIDKYAKTFLGIDGLLKHIVQHKLLWGIITNKPENLTHLLLDKLGIKPDVVVCGDTLSYNKPHPAPLFYACACLAVKPSSCLFVGDDKIDMLTGRDAGIKTVAVTYGYNRVQQDWGYDYVVDSPQEIQRLI